jgi:hypothetical protein
MPVQQKHAWRSEKLTGPEADKKPVEVVDDGKAVHLVLEELRAGYLHELKMENLAAKDGAKLLHPEAYHPLVRIPN